MSILDSPSDAKSKDHSPRADHVVMVEEMTTFFVAVYAHILLRAGEMTTAGDSPNKVSELRAV